MVIRFAAALLALAVLCSGTAPAHEGHDAVPPAAGILGASRAEAHSESFELVAVRRGGDLVVYLDGLATNAPVAGAHLDVGGPHGTTSVQPRGDGTYVLAASRLAEGGNGNLTVTVTADGVSELIELDLPRDVPAAAVPQDHPAPSMLVSDIREHLGHQAPIGAAAGGFLLGLATIALRRARFVSSSVAVAAFALVLLIGGAALAHEGHHHSAPLPTGDALPAPALIERSGRQPDGSVFMPKSAQRLLVIRTALTAETRHRRTVELPGRIISDPNASGVVQSSVGGRLAPPPGGFPNLGAHVRKGDLLATVTPPVQAVDMSDMRQTQGDLDQQIAIVARRVARYEKLAASGAVAQTALDDARAELGGLRDRRAAIDAVRREPEALIAPVDGAVSERAAVAGQMAAPGTMVFRIVDPDRLYVEALSFDALDPGTDATARLSDGRSLTLSYRGAGLADRNQAVPVQFAIGGGTTGLRLGQFVTVLAPTSETTEGLALPRTSVLRSESGAIVYEHVSAERFQARPVRVEPLDAERVIVAGGLSAGRRIVTQGADLIDQVR